MNTNILLRRFCAGAILCIITQCSVPIMPAFADEGQVTIGDSVVLTTNAASAQTIQDNLDNALVAASNRGPASVHVVNAKTGSVITLGGYKIVTVTASNARAAKTTAPLLAKRWADALRKQLANSNNVNAYISQISGDSSGPLPDEPAAAPARRTTVSVAPSTAPAVAPSCAPNSAQPSVQVSTAAPPTLQGRVLFAPAGLVLPVRLRTSVSSEVSNAGDLIEGELTDDVTLDNWTIPAGSVVAGQVSDSESGRRLGRSGELSVVFNQLRLPDGTTVPITTHVVGGIGKYATSGSDQGDTMRGETAKNKVESAAIRSLVGAGTGAALGTAVGAIAGEGHDGGAKHAAGRGAWSGAAIGGGLGLADSLLLRKGANIKIESGTKVQLQLDQPIQITAAQ